jgi:hypothetical protein
MDKVFKLNKRVIADVEMNVQSRIAIRRHIYCLGGHGELNVIGSLPVELHYQKVLAYRRSRFNQKSSPRNLHLLRQAIYACHYINSSLDEMRVSEYVSEKHSNA